MNKDKDELKIFLDEKTSDLHFLTKRLIFEKIFNKTEDEKGR